MLDHIGIGCKNRTDVTVPLKPEVTVPLMKAG